MSEPIQDCTSVISSIRALPSQSNNPIHCEYLNTKGRIVNNIYDSKTSKYVIPKKDGCPFETSLNIPKSVARVECTDTLGGGLKCGEEDKLYRLPSLVLMVQNNVNCSITPVTIEDAFCNFTSDKLLCLPGQCETSLCTDQPLPGDPCGVSPYNCEDGSRGVVEFKPNGILAAVYNIALWQNYQYFSKKNIYEFIVYPYRNTAACKPGVAQPPCKNRSLEPRACSEGDLIPPVVGTFPFCIGGKYSCACVNLLIHGKLRRDDLSDGCLVSDLHWVGVRLYFKNKEGNVCSKNPASVHIQVNKSDPLRECFKPYFATTRQVITSYTRLAKSCPEYPTDCEQQFGPSLIGDCGTYPNYPFPPCPISSNYPDPCAGDRRCEAIDLIWISDCIDFDEFTCFQTCKIFIVLLPTTRCKSIIC